MANSKDAVVEDQAFGVQIRQTPSRLFVRIGRIVHRREPLVDTLPAPSVSQHVHVRLERQWVLVAFLLNALVGPFVTV